MFGELDKYVLVFLTGLLVTYLLTPVVRGLAHKYGVVDKPDERRPHKRIIGVHAACLVAVLFPWSHSSGALDFGWWQKYALASLVLLVVGVIDDVRGMKPLIKLGGQIGAALVMWFSGTHFGQFLGHDLQRYAIRGIGMNHSGQLTKR